MMKECTNMKKEKKLLLTGAIVALMAICIPNFNPQASSNEGVQQEVLSKVLVQGTSVSLNGVVNALNGTVAVDEQNADKTTFKAQGKEIITTNGSGVVLVNGEEDVYVVDKEAENSTLNLVKWVEAYSYQDEVFVPIEFVERVFDLTYNEESLEFSKGEETVIEVEVIEELQEEEAKDDSELNGPSEEEKEEDKESEEPSKEESDKVEAETGNNNSNTGATNNGSTNTGSNNSGVTSKPNNSGSSNSASGNTGSNNSGSASKPNNSGSSNAGSNNSVPAPSPKPEPKPQEPVTPPAPQPVKVTSITTDKVSLTLEVGQTGKMTANVQPSNADNKGVTFVSSNTSVATVDGNGNITAKGAGSALITAKSNENGNISVSIGVTVNAKPAPQPTYTGNSIVNRAVSELGWCKSSDGLTAFLGPYGCQTGLDGRSVEASAMNGSNGWDVSINIMDSTASGVVSGVESIIRWLMPSQGQQLINKLHDPNYYGGTHTFDGRKVTVEIKSYGIAIRICPKY